MFYVYILRSSKSGILYYGYTTDLKKRFKEHNNSKSKFTKGHLPWKLVFYCAFVNKQKAKILNYTSNQDLARLLPIRDS